MLQIIQWAEQIPSDWWEAVGIACHQCLADAKIDHSTIKGVCLDATCCSVVALDSNFVYACKFFATGEYFFMAKILFN